MFRKLVNEGKELSTQYTIQYVINILDKQLIGWREICLYRSYPAYKWRRNDKLEHYFAIFNEIMDLGDELQ